MTALLAVLDSVPVPAEPARDAGISLTYAEFLDATTRLRKVGFPLEREPEDAWPHFAGWRVEPMPPLRPMPGSKD